MCRRHVPVVYSSPRSQRPHLLKDSSLYSLSCSTITPYSPLLTKSFYIQILYTSFGRVVGSREPDWLFTCLFIFVADSVNRGISTARRMHAASTIGLSINKDLKLKKRKEKDKQQHKKLYIIIWLYKGYITLISAIIAILLVL